MREYLFNMHIPQHSMLPIEVQRDTSLRIVLKYSEICEIETEIIGKSLVFVAIPLIEDNDYQLFELIPYLYADSYPNLVYHTILPKNKCLILSTHTNRYTMIETLEKCISVTPILLFLCQLHDLNGVSNGPCEVGIRYKDISQCHNRLQSIIAEP